MIRVYEKLCHEHYSVLFCKTRDGTKMVLASQVPKESGLFILTFEWVACILKAERSIGNESVPKIIIKDAVNLF